MFGPTALREKALCPWCNLWKKHIGEQKSAVSISNPPPKSEQHHKLL